MHRLILLSHAPGLAPGAWQIDQITPVAAGDLVALAYRKHCCINLITFETTLDVIWDISRAAFPRHDTSPSATGHRTAKQRIVPQPGDLFLCCLLNEHGKQKPRGADLLSSDIDFYRVCVL